MIKVEKTLIATNPVKVDMNFAELNHLLEESAMVIDQEQKKHLKKKQKLLQKL